MVTNHQTCIIMCLFMQKSFVLAMVELLLVVSTTILLFTGTTQSAALPGGDDERYEKEYQSSSPGAHELATWLIAQLRQSSNQAAATNTVGGCRYGPTVKRNSEIINSLLRLPQMDNGRK
ncbi:hypothetical protein CBL_09942 [Carabus blaptoides fortunei]